MNQDIPAARDEQRADQVPRRFMMPGKRLPGLIAIASLPVIALLGLTRQQATTQVEQDGILFSVDYPRVERFLNPTTMTLSVTNRTDSELTAATVALDREYLQAYSTIELKPGEEHVTDGSFVVSLGDIEPGDTRSVRVELRSRQHWWHRGTMTLNAGESELTASVGTLLLP